MVGLCSVCVDSLPSGFNLIGVSFDSLMCVEMFYFCWVWSCVMCELRGGRVVDLMSSGFSLGVSSVDSPM